MNTAPFDFEFEVNQKKRHTKAKSWFDLNLNSFEIKKKLFKILF